MSSTTSLATNAAHRLLAWPRYEQPADLDSLARHFGPLLVGRTDVCLCLRHDLTRDVPLADAVRAVEAAFARAHGDGATVEVLVVDDSLDSAGWASLGRAVTAVLALPSILTDPDRRARLAGLGHQLVVTTAELQAALGPAPMEPAAAPAPPSNPAQPAVSVIVPTRDRPWFLTRALHSLAAQTFRDFEVLVVNDGGSGVESVLESLAAPLTIQYIRHAGARGPAAARNSALALARGQFIAYLDDDDRVHPDHLETLVGALLGGSHQVAYGDATWVLEERVQAGADDGGYRSVRPILTRSQAFDRRLLMLANTVPLSSLMHGRACVDAVGVFDETLTTHEDWDLIIRLAWRFGMVHVARNTADISWREDGSSACSARAADFSRTMRLIHERYRGLVKDDADIVAGQAAMVAAPATAAPAPNVVFPRRSDLRATMTAPTP